MPRSAPIDGFSLAYDRSGLGSPVLLLHGWPGTRRDFRALVPLLADAMEVVVPDLRGFGESDKHAVEPEDGYSAAAQARSVVGLMDELALSRVVLAGYDIGSRIAQTVARTVPQRVRALVLAPPLPGAGDRVLTPDAQREFWYQAFHQLELVDQLLDGKPDAIRAYVLDRPGFCGDRVFSFPSSHLRGRLERTGSRRGRPGRSRPCSASHAA